MEMGMMGFVEREVASGFAEFFPFFFFFVYFG
jgi:hypothetical protein